MEIIYKMLLNGIAPVFIMSNLWSSIALSELVEGFPEGCAFASIKEPLPDHQLRFGRIRWMGSSWIFSYVDQSAPGPFQTAQVAQNLGRMGQDPEQDISVNLLALTPRDNYVVAQVLDRDDFGLDPIVTCVSHVFRGKMVPGRVIVYESDYWAEMKRARLYKFDTYRQNRWQKWRKKRAEERRYWKKRGWSKKRPKPDGRPRPDGKPKPDYKPKPDGRPKPDIKPRPDRDDGKDKRPRPGIRPRPDREREQEKRLKPGVKPRPEPDDDQDTGQKRAKKRGQGKRTSEQRSER